MNTENVKSKASGIALMGKVLVGVMVLGAGVMPRVAEATVTDFEFRQFITTLCGGAPQPGWDIVSLSAMCTDAAPGFIGSGGVASANVGTSNASGGLTLKKKKGGYDSNETPVVGASGDGGGWGMLVTPQYGKTSRSETDWENGYQSDLRGLVLGLDYRFSDTFILGMALGHTKDTANFLNSAGSLKSSSNTATVYSTWMVSENSSIDGYVGYGAISLDSRRQVNFGLISGMTGGSTSGRQILAGMSASYQAELGRAVVAPFINLDYITTKIDGYRETGSTTMELKFAERKAISFTSSVGTRLGSSYGYKWGTLLPSISLAAVHEFQNKSKQINNELVSTPGYGFSVTTDSADRNYLNIGLGMAAALNGGAQLFLDYEKRTQDKLLSSWAVSLGGLFEF